MLQINKITIKNFACFDDIVIEPSTTARKPLTVIRAENGSGKTTLLRAIRWGMYGEKGLPGNAEKFSIHPASWDPDGDGIETLVAISFNNDGSSRNHETQSETIQQYELRRTVKTYARTPETPDHTDFVRRDEDAELLEKKLNGSWTPHRHGVDLVIEELLPIRLKDFFVMDADEAADFVGGGENKPVDHKDVVEKTSFAVRSLLGLEVFEDTIENLTKISQRFGRAASKESRLAKIEIQHDRSESSGGRWPTSKKITIQEAQEELDKKRVRRDEITQRLRENTEKLKDCMSRLEDKKIRIGKLASRSLPKDEIEARLKENKDKVESATVELKEATKKLSDELTSTGLLATLAFREVCSVKNLLEPMYEEGTIPLRHLPFVRGLLEKGVCVCGEDLTARSERRSRVRTFLDQSMAQAEKADYLEQVYHATNEMRGLALGEGWEERCKGHERAIAEIGEQLSDLTKQMIELDQKLNEINDDELQLLRSKVEALEKQVPFTRSAIESDEDSLGDLYAAIHKLEADLRTANKRHTRSKELIRCQEIAELMIENLRSAYSRILDDQVEELNVKMNSLFLRMAANVVDDEMLESVSHKATIRMIESVGIRLVDKVAGTLEIYAINRRGNSMPPTEINGASRRILALSFVLALCEVSRTRAPLIADSLLNFMSGLVRTNTLRVTSQTASQPILLLTGSDLESAREEKLVSEFAGKTYTLTGQWQHKSQGGDVVNLNDNRQVSLLCDCGPREYCVVCERDGQTEDVGLKFIDRGKLQ